jgi:uncharacterized membrane protein YjjB (DUF3815 family)
MFVHNVGGGIVFLGLATIAQGIAILLAYEALALLTGGYEPITWMVDHVTAKHFYGVTAAVAVAAIVIGLLVGHFWWPNNPPAWVTRLPGFRR